MVSRAASFAAKKGMIVTNSAGNEGSNSWKYIVFPADDERVCAVACHRYFQVILLPSAVMVMQEK